MRDEKTIKNIPKTAVIGASGFIGSAFLPVYRQIYPDCVGTSKVKNKDTLAYFDLLTPDISNLHLSESQHKEALIVAAIPKIHECEINKDFTRNVNVNGTLELIRQLASKGIKPIFTSSDYVFDGITGNYIDESNINPITEYGKQKAEVEIKIAEITKGNYLVIRLGKIFSLEKNDGTLLDEIAGILSSGGVINAAYDQIFCPMVISDLVDIIINLQLCQITGIINVCGPEIWSRHQLALEIAKAMDINPDKVKKVSLDEIGLGGRPKNTSMKINRLLKVTDSKFTPIKKSIEEVAKNWKEKIEE